MWLLRAVIVLLLLWPHPAAAQGSTDFIEVHVIDAYGNALAVAEVGCSMTEDPAPIGYNYDPRCTNCSYAVCYNYEGDWKGGYFIYSQAGMQYTYEAAPESGTYGVWPSSGSPWDERHNFVLWPADWEGTHVLTFTVSLPIQTPTPIPTLTPYPYPGPTSVNFTTGFGPGFTETYGALSGYGIIPDFGLDHTQWLFSARKWIQVINQGNLLYVMGGILLAVLVLKWAIDRVKNPR